MAAHQAPPFLGFSRQEYWSGLPFSSLSIEILIFPLVVVSGTISITIYSRLIMCLALYEALSVEWQMTFGSETITSNETNRVISDRQ